MSVVSPHTWMTDALDAWTTHGSPLRAPSQTLRHNGILEWSYDPWEDLLGYEVGGCHDVIHEVGT